MKGSKTSDTPQEIQTTQTVKTHYLKHTQGKRDGEKYR